MENIKLIADELYDVLGDVLKDWPELRRKIDEIKDAKEIDASTDSTIIL